MSIVTASVRGQIVIPKEVRKRLGITPGKRLLGKVDGDQVVITPLPDDPVDAFCGIFSGGTSLTKALLDVRRKDSRRD